MFVQYNNEILFLLGSLTVIRSYTQTCIVQFKELIIQFHYITTLIVKLFVTKLFVNQYHVLIMFVQYDNELLLFVGSFTIT